MKMLEHKIPPPIVALLCVGLAWLLPAWLGLIAIPNVMRLVLITLCVVTGLGISFSGMREFRKAKTTVNPIKINDGSSLVSSGIFNYTRNPMYLGLLVVQIGWVVYLANPISVLAPIVFVLFINRFQIQPEERVMQSLFGSAYDEYKTRVRAWI